MSKNESTWNSRPRSGGLAPSRGEKPGNLPALKPLLCGLTASMSALQWRTADNSHRHTRFSWKPSEADTPSATQRRGSSDSHMAGETTFGQKGPDTLTVWEGGPRHLRGSSTSYLDSCTGQGFQDENIPIQLPLHPTLSHMWTSISMSEFSEAGISAEGSTVWVRSVAVGV